MTNDMGYSLITDGAHTMLGSNPGFAASMTKEVRHSHTMYAAHEFHVNVNQRDKIKNAENYAKYMLFSFIRTFFHE